MKRSGKGSHHTTIIKRSSKKGHGAHHGGAWKVAFADFTLAMMALFMVLWIINSVSQEEREEIVAVLNGHSVFDGNPFSPINSLDAKHNSYVNQQIRKAANTGTIRQQSSSSDSESAKASSDGSSNSIDSIVSRSKQEMEELARIIMTITESYGADSNLKIEIIPQGLRVLIQDDKSREMFHRGSANLTPFFDKLLRELAPVFEQIDNSLIITGHTDSIPFKSRDLYNNWNLSGDRAMAARRVLERGGLAEKKVLQVNAMSDQMLLDKEDPTSASNRRIEIMVLTTTASDSLYQFFGQHGENVVKPAIQRTEGNS